jgi:xanthine dehydrogenase accessory factor
MKELYGEIIKSLSVHESIAAVTIFNMSGSAPRDEGAKMIVRPDGSIMGTIGGGKLEAEAIRFALESYVTKKSAAISFDLTGADAAEMNMICGGIGEFLIDYIDAGDSVNLDLYKNILDVMEKREKAWVVTEIGAGAGNREFRQQCLVRRDRSIVGRFESDKAFLAKLIQGPARITIHSEIRDDRRLLVEPIRTPATVYIFGAGHVAHKFAPLAELVGFRTVVIDDRAEYANRLRFPSSELIVLKSFEDPLPNLPFDKDSYLVIVTRGHVFDKTVLRQIIRKPVAYIGMIGSIVKRTTVYQSLADECGFTDDDFSRVYSPIGIEIKAESPEEIAISMIAELILVRANLEQCIDKVK